MPMTEEQKRAYRKAYQERKREDERIRALIPSPSTLPSAPISNLVPAEMPRGDAFAREMTLADQAEQNRMNARTRKLSSLDNAFGAEEQSLDLPFQKQETVDPFMKPLKKLSVDDLPTAEEYNEPKKNNVSMDKVDKWLDPNYQLSKEEKKEAQETAESFFSRYGLEHAPMKDIYKYAAEHPEFNEEYEKMKKLTLKATTLGNFGSGFKSAFTDVASGLADMAIGKTKDNADKYAGLVSSMTGVPEEEVRNTIGNAYGQIAEKKQDIFNPIEAEKENAKTQNSLAYGAGNLGGKALQYIATEPLFAGAAASAGLGKGGAFVANQVGQNAQDLALDTLPSYYEMQRQGLSDDEIGKELAKNIGINAGMNLGMGVLGEIPGLVRNAKNAKNIPQLSEAEKMQEYFRSQANPTIERQLLDELNASDRRIAEEAEAVRESRLTSDMIPQEAPVKAPRVEAPVEAPKAPQVGRALDADDARPANVENDIPNVEPRDRSIAMAANSGGGMGDGEVRKFSDMFKEDLPEAETDIPNVERSIPLEANDNVLRTKTSQGRTNTLERAGIDNEQELKEVIPESDFEYIPEQNKEQIAQASDMISSPQGRERAIERYTRDIDDKYAKDMGAVDIFAMAELRKDLNMAARAAVDPAEKAALYAQSRQIAVNLTKAGRASGRTLQAMSVLTRSADGAMMAAEGYARNAVEDALKGMPNVKTDIESVTQEIKGFLDNMDASAMTREQIEDAIEKAISTRKHLKTRVTKNDVKELTDAILNDRAWNDIQDHLEYLATGYKQISPETMDEVQSIFEEAYQLPYNSRQRMKLEQQAFNKLGAEIAPKGGTFGEKFDAWRYLAMLANPSTHIKNMVGNIAFGKGLVSIKNTIAAGIEAAAERVAKATGKDFKRTKAILTPADNELVKLARQDGIDNAFRELAGNKYMDVGSAIDEATPAFNQEHFLGRGINKAADINSKALSGEDEIAGLGKYQTSMAGFLKANGADASIFNATDDASKELLEQARQYAISQAKESTFHQDSRVANALSQFTKNLRNNDKAAAKALGLTIDTIIPFKKTPINILRSTIQYSPVEMFKVLTDIPKVKKGIMSGAEMIDDIAKTATGTGMLAIGALLAHNGIITSGFTDSDEKTTFDRTTGRQGIALHINIPGKQPFTISLSELSPAAMPLIFGAAVYESKKKQDVDDSALDVIINGLSASVNAITDMTMLSGISDLLSNIRYAESDADVIKKIGSHVVGNLAGQMIPSVGGRIEKAIDENKRSTYATNSGTLGELERIGRQAANKIPFLNPIADQLAESDNEVIANIGGAIRNQNSIDAWGREMKQPGINALGRAALNLVSPVSIQADNSDELDQALYAIEERSGLPAYPKTTQSEGNIDGTRLTGDQFTQYAKSKGQLSRELAEQLILSGEYEDTNDETKAGALNTMYGFAKAMAQDEAVGKEMSSTNAKLKEIYAKDGAKGVVDYVVRGSETKEIAKQAGIKNNDVVKKAYDEGGATLAEQAANTISTLQDAGLKQSAYYTFEQAQSVIPQLDPQTFIQTYKSIDSDGNSSIKKSEMAAYLNAIKANASQAQQIINAYGGGWKKPLKQDDNGKWKG